MLDDAQVVAIIAALYATGYGSLTAPSETPRWQDDPKVQEAIADVGEAVISAIQDAFESRGSPHRTQRDSSDLVREPLDALCDAVAAVSLPTPTFSDESYAVPLEHRLNLFDFHHPRLGIHSTGQHTIPLTTDEGQMLLALYKGSLLAPHSVPWRDDPRVQEVRARLISILDGGFSSSTQVARALDVICDAVAAPHSGTPDA